MAAPQNAYVRRIQHQTPTDNLESRSFGKEPYRRVQLTRGRRLHVVSLGGMVIAGLPPLSFMMIRAMFDPRAVAGESELTMDEASEFAACGGFICSRKAVIHGSGGVWVRFANELACRYGSCLR